MKNKYEPTTCTPSRPPSAMPHFSKIWSYKSIRGGGSLGMRRVSIPKANIFNLSILKSLELSKKFAVVENDFSVFALT